MLDSIQVVYQYRERQKSSLQNHIMQPNKKGTYNRYPINRY